MPALASDSLATWGQLTRAWAWHPVRTDSIPFYVRFFGGGSVVASLFVIQGRDQGTRFELDSDSDTFPVGREAGNRTQLHDTEVSRHHAKIRGTGNEFLVCDLGTSNGTFVNNERVERRELTSGDQL